MKNKAKNKKDNVEFRYKYNIFEFMPLTHIALYLYMLGYTHRTGNKVTFGRRKIAEELNSTERIIRTQLKNLVERNLLQLSGKGLATKYTVFDIYTGKNAVKYSKS